MTRFNISTFVVVGLILLNSIFGVTIAINQAQINDLQKNSMVAEVKGVASIPMYDPNYLMNDSTFSSTRAFPTEQSVQNYLDSINSPLKNYSENGRKASYWIFSAARGATSSKWGIVPQINPGLLLAYLEKEQSLLSLTGYNTSTDPDNRIRTAMGYGCPDTSVCDAQYYGLSNQLNWAAYQLQFNYDRSATASPLVAPYHLNKTITTLDEYNVFLTNQATAANYRYTPHVYWGNYNLWKIIVANGWGVSSQTYSMRDIDNANLANKDATVEISTQPTVSVATATPLIQKEYTLGQQSEDIKTLQRFLRQEGYFMTREITGLYGTITQQAHFSYRRDKGILNNLSSLSARCKELINKQWTIGQESQEVSELQQCLRDIGAFNWPTNSGYFGPVTSEALEAVRKAMNQDSNTQPQPVDQCEALKNVQYQDGERSQRVVDLQVCMRAKGYFNWPNGNTGYFGPVTSEALKNWRAATNENTVTPTPTPTPNPAPADKCEELKNRQWTLGTSSPEVAELQSCMRVKGYFNWPYGNTGYFGSVTAESLSKWRGETLGSISCDNLKTQVWVMEERSERVRQLQSCMRDAGKFNWPYGNTGYFGSVTRDSLIAWRGYF